MRKRTYYTIWSILILIFLYLIVYTYFSVFHIMTPVEFHNEPFPVWQDGDNICYYLDHTRYTDVGVTITRSFRDGILFVTPPVTANGTDLGRHKVTICFPLPKTLPSGDYEIFNEITFHVNPFATRTVQSKTQMISIEH